MSHKWPFAYVTASVLDRGKWFWSCSSTCPVQSPQQDRLYGLLLPKKQLVQVPWRAIGLWASFRLLLKETVTLTRVIRIHPAYLTDYSGFSFGSRCYDHASQVTGNWQETKRIMPNALCKPMHMRVCVYMMYFISPCIWKFFTSVNWSCHKNLLFLI